jgi:hypothetical protein
MGTARLQQQPHELRVGTFAERNGGATIFPEAAALRTRSIRRTLHLPLTGCGNSSRQVPCCECSFAGELVYANNLTRSILQRVQVFPCWESPTGREEALERPALFTAASHRLPALAGRVGHGFRLCIAHGVAQGFHGTHAAQQRFAFLAKKYFHNAASAIGLRSIE